MPLLPGFEGEIDSEGSNVMKIQLHWEYLSISRGGRSIIEQLQLDPNIPDPSEYITFIGLRTHGQRQEKPVSEIIYVHSKVLRKPPSIADDRR
jgi:phospholipase D1/2